VGLGLALVLCGLAVPAFAQDAAALTARHEAVRAQLAASPFGRPLLLASDPQGKDPQGDAYAVVAYPFRVVEQALRRPEQWCEVMTLQTTLKRCSATPDGQLQMRVTRRWDQPAGEGTPIAFRYTVRAADAGYLSVQMTADSGPAGTSNYRLALEAVPVDAQHTFLHMSYAYASGMAARLATDAYLATSGRDKVGFSTEGNGPDGKPALVGGVRGVAERATMRYYLAIEAVLKTAALPAERRDEARLREWYAATQRYPRQLKEEMSQAQYVAMKRQDAQP
jgi:hypothetical protein